MGRGRGKGKKQVVRDDGDSGEEEKLPANKRRGRPQKPLKNEVDEDEETEKIEDDGKAAKSSITNNENTEQGGADNGKKRKRSSQVKEDSSPVVENGSGTKSSTVTDGSVKPVGFRQNGHRRKSKPRRAAEAGVECN